MGRRKRRRVDPTHEWEQIELLCAWGEQVGYERIGPLVLFGEPVPERAGETGTPERTLCRRIAAFRDGGMGSLYDASLSRGAKLEAVDEPPPLRRPLRGGAAQALRVAGPPRDAGWPKALGLEGCAVRSRRP